MARTADGHYLELKVIDNQDGRITAIIQQGDIANISSEELGGFSLLTAKEGKGKKLG